MLRRTLASLSFAALLFVANGAFALEPPPPADAPAVESVPAHQRPGAAGVHLVLLGPVGNYGAALAYQLMPQLELQLGAVTQSPSATASSGGVTANASISVLTPFARGRYWFFGRHSLIAELGAGAMYYDAKADASDLAGNSVHYARSSTIPLLFGGAGYGFRTDAGFRLAVLMGWMQYLGSAGGSTVSTTGNFSAQDRAELHSSLDTTSERLTEARLYLELSCGWMF